MSLHTDEQPRIFKYSFGPIDRGILTTKIKGPRFTDILDIQEQGHRLVMWAIVDTAQLGGEHTLRIYCAYTGDAPPSNEWIYFKTIQSDFDGLARAA